MQINKTKLAEQRVGKAFIAEYNQKCGTDYLLDHEYDEQFPDLCFESSSDSRTDLFAEVVSVLESEEQKAKNTFVANLQDSLGAELRNLKCKGLVVAIQCTELPSTKKDKVWTRSVARYVLNKLNDLNRNQFTFDNAKDGRSFWDMSHVKSSIRSLRIKRVDGFDKILVRLTSSQARRAFPEAYLYNAIQKKSGKYSPKSIEGITLLLDCDFPAIDEVDMEEFAEQAKKVNPGFREIWCVNILLNRTIVKQIA